MKKKWGKLKNISRGFWGMKAFLLTDRNVFKSFIFLKHLLRRFFGVVLRVKYLVRRCILDLLKKPQKNKKESQKKAF